MSLDGKGSNLLSCFWLITHNIPSSLKLHFKNIFLFFFFFFKFLCILLHVEEQYGSCREGFGPNDAVWLEKPCVDLA